MTPRKERCEKASDGDGAAMILKYLKEQNRPYSATDISSNLHNRVTRTQTTKLLKELHERQEIESKASGKQTIYHAIQQVPAQNIEDTVEALSSALPPTVAEFDTAITSLRSTLNSQKTRVKHLKLELANLGTIPTIDDLQSRISAAEPEKLDLQGEILKLQRKCEGLKYSCITVVTQAERKSIMGEHARWKRLVGTRKKICKDIWDICCEALPEAFDGDKGDFWESLGLEGQI